MALTLVTGTISLTRERKDVSATSNTITTQTTTEFRIGNRPARISGGVNLAPGDQVRAAGKDSAELEVLALCNDTTSVQYTAPCPSLLIIASMLLLPIAGIALALNGEQFVGQMFFLMGLVTFPAGLIMIWKRNRVLAAVRMVEQAGRG